MMKKLVLGFWFVDSVAIFALWGVTFASGRGWPGGLFTYQSGNIPIFHLIAELLMATVVLVGLIAWRRGQPWGPPLTLLGAGMFAYSSINSMGWAVHNQPVLLVPMALSLCGVPPLFALVRRAHTT